MEKHTIHIAFCVNNNYIPYIIVTCISILENNTSNNITIHVFIDTISEKNKRLLKDNIKKYKNGKIEIHLVNDSLLIGLKDTWSIYAWYRILIPEILPDNIHRILYLDADIIVKDNLEDLFLINMDDKSIASTIDIETFNEETFLRCKYDKDKKYICSGVLLMNLDYWRKENLTNKIILWAKENNHLIKFPDQDTINYICQDTKILLPIRYGIQAPFLTNNKFYKEPYYQELKDCITKPAIIHYAGCNPWIKELSTHPFTIDWIKYNKKMTKPVKRFYKTKGWLFFKMIVWNILHPNRNKNKLTIEDVKNRLMNS